jgi:hypothetical protein
MMIAQRIYLPDFKASRAIRAASKEKLAITDRHIKFCKRKSQEDLP